jgi:hypothetical protein
MIMLIKALGPDYIVWDKAATIRFLRPGRETLHATSRTQGKKPRLCAALVKRAPVQLRRAPAAVISNAGRLRS